MGPEIETVRERLRTSTYGEGGSGGKPTRIKEIELEDGPLLSYTNEFWTSGQRKGSSLHEISYRACFKPQLPEFFIDLLSGKDDVILDPFSGRGTTIIQAGLMGKGSVSNDINPLSRILTEPRIDPPEFKEIEERLDSLNLNSSALPEIDLSMFYHADTLSQIMSLRGRLEDLSRNNKEDMVDKWIRMVATNRLTGHSSGFFSVYTLPPNQAVSPQRQLLINKKRDQKPAFRDVKKLILKKSRSLLRNLTEEDRNKLSSAYPSCKFLETDSSDLKGVGNETIGLTVTSPPFLNIVQYSTDNWLRCWFNGIDSREVQKKITGHASVSAWAKKMGDIFEELFRVTVIEGWVAFEVGEVKNRKINLDEIIVPLGLNAGFECAGIVINEQSFTKTSNIWGVDNNQRGTNTNRIVLFRK